MDNETNNESTFQKYGKMLNFLIENLDRNDRYIIFKKHASLIKKHVSRGYINWLNSRRSHLSNKLLMQLMYYYPEIFETIIKLIMKKIRKLNISVIELTKNQKDLKEIIKSVYKDLNN